MTRFRMFCSCLLALSLCSGAPSDDKPPEKPDKNAEHVEKALASLAAAYNGRDARAVAELFTPKGEFIDGDGNVFHGRDAVAREFTALFEINPRISIKMAVQVIREISPGVLSVDCVASLSGSAGAESDEIEFVALVVRQADGRWLLASIRSHGDESDDSPHAQLKRLEWLIGDWIDESDESTLHTSSRWSDDGNFILTSFEIHVAGRKVMTGTQRIGWDGSLETFKSWVFDSDGGHAEGTWTEKDDYWIVQSTGVSSDGLAGSATQTYEHTGADSYGFSMTDRIIGGEKQPDFTARVVRTPPKPEGALRPAAPPKK